MNRSPQFLSKSMRSIISTTTCWSIKTDLEINSFKNKERMLINQPESMATLLIKWSIRSNKTTIQQSQNDSLEMQSFRVSQSTLSKTQSHSQSNHSQNTKGSFGTVLLQTGLSRIKTKSTRITLFKNDCLIKRLNLQIKNHRLNWNLSWVKNCWFIVEVLNCRRIWSKLSEN